MDAQMADAIQKMEEIHEKNRLGGGKEQIERQHKREKLTARERIDILLDPGTFSEIGACVNTTGIRIDGKSSDAPCDGSVVGTGKVDGRWVAVYASDFTVMGGSLGTQHGMKFIKLIEMAARWGISMVWLLDSSGGRLGYQDVPMAGVDWWFALESRYSGLIPQINVLMGPCIAGQAYCPTLCDFLLMSRKTAHLWLGGPRMTQAATSETIGENVGGADYHMEYSGTCDIVGEDDRETILKARTLLSYLPANFKKPAPRKEPRDDPMRKVDELLEIVPADFQKTYDMHQVIKAVVDDGEVFEIKSEYAKPLITCFCRFNGSVAGLVAGNPAQPGPMLSIDSCDKYYRFLQTLDAYSIPLVTLLDTPPELPGQDQEAKGLLRHFGKIIDVYATATIPKISIILREAYADAGSIIMGCGKGMGVDLCYAWPNSRLAVEASGLDYRKVYGRGIDENAYEGYLNRAREKVDVFRVANSWSAQVVDEVIHPAETRQKIIEAIALTREKTDQRPARAKTHGAPPV